MCKGASCEDLRAVASLCPTTWRRGAVILPPAMRMFSCGHTPAFSTGLLDLFNRFPKVFDLTHVLFLTVFLREAFPGSQVSPQGDFCAFRNPLLFELSPRPRNGDVCEVTQKMAGEMVSKRHSCLKLRGSWTSIQRDKRTPRGKNSECPRGARRGLRLVAKLDAR